MTTGFPVVEVQITEVEMLAFGVSGELISVSNFCVQRMTAGLRAKKGILTQAFCICNRRISAGSDACRDPLRAGTGREDLPSKLVKPCLACFQNILI